jgi:hypothetical protein
MSQDRKAPLSHAKRLLFSLIMLLVVLCAIEALSYLLYRRVTGSPFGAVAVSVDPLSQPEHAAVREEAGLGFRDDALSLHPYLGYVYTPRAPGVEGRVPISIDGFLDDATAIRKRSTDRVLVGIVGGSVAGQLGTWHSERLRTALMALPRFAGRTIDFVKLGLPGYHQPQQVQQLTWLLAQGGELDILINLDGFNEVAVPAALNRPKGVHALFPMNWSMVALDVPDLDIRRHIGAVTYLQEERQTRAARFREAAWSRSALARLLWKVQDNRLAQASARHAWALQQFKSDETPFFIRGPESGHAPEEDYIPWCVAVWKRSSLALQALCDAFDIQYIHVLQPNQYLPESKPLSTEEKTTAYDAESPYREVVEKGYPLLREAGKELTQSGILFYDLALLFKDNTDTFYTDNCCHFNAAGNELLSQAIAAALAL